MWRSLHRVAIALPVAMLACLHESAVSAQTPSEQVEVAPTFADAQHLFYNASYEAAAALTLELASPEGEGLAACELRTSALLFQLKRLLGSQSDKSAAFKRCETCPALMSAFLRDTARGQTLARNSLKLDPTDEEALFFLGKIDLNYVWLQLDPLGKKTGWNEYWEARRSLDAVLSRNPHHVRALVARAWIDYIVDTRLPRGTKWLLGGGGGKKRAMTVIRQAAGAESDFFVRAEAGFALWEMQVRERRIAEAREVALGLARDFPDNQQIAEFLERTK